MVVMTLLLACLSTAAEAQTQKLKAEEIIARHLEAIGGAETIQSVSTRISQGTVVVTFKEPGTGQLGGRVVLASEGPKSLMAMAFDNATNYPHERIAYDGKDVSGGYVHPGARSSLGDFLLTNQAILKQGIWGGELSQAWMLLNPNRKVKVEAGGMKKIGDRQTYQLKCYPTGSDLKIAMYFDAESFQHVRTEYERSVIAQMGGTPETSAHQSETRYKLVEEFSDFKKEGGLTLPHAYKINLEITTGRAGAVKAQWELSLSEFKFNQHIEPGSFDVGG
jgi:outer membrane lipoprotein-sorting protein